MQPSRLTQLLGLLCVLATVESVLIMTATNARVTVDKTRAKLGSEFKIMKGSKMSVSCRLSNSTGARLDSPKISWQGLQSGNPTVTETVSSDGLSFESTLTLTNPLSASVSAYVCNGTSNNQTVSATAAFNSQPLLSIALSGGGGLTNRWTTVVHPDLLIETGAATTVKCQVHGFPKGTASWQREDSGGKLVTVVNGTRLELSSASYENDRGYYVCQAVNNVGSNSLRIFLRIKNPKAFLFPLITLTLLIVACALICAAQCAQCAQKEAP